jgi:PilZ domain
MSRLPLKEAEVTLAVPQRERVPARVQDTGPGWVDLELQKAPSTPPSLMAQGGLFVEFVNDEGLCRLLGKQGTRDGRRPIGGWGVNDVLRVVHTNGVQLLQARSHIRAEWSTEVVLRNVFDGQRQKTRTIDLSGGGALLQGISGGRAGDAFDFELEMPGHELPITGRLKVVRFTSSMKAGVQFTEVSQGDRGRLTRHVVDMQAAEREKRRNNRG